MLKLTTFRKLTRHVLSLYLLAVLCKTKAQKINNFWTEGLEISFDSYENWAQQINNTQPFLIVYPKTSQEIASIVTWAHTVGRNVRVQGYRHSYPALTVSERDSPLSTVIIDMTRHMKTMRMGSMTLPNPATFSTTKLNTVIAETGASMEEFTTFAEKNGFGIVMGPIVGGDATLGGVLAVGAHGAAIPALREKLTGPGYSFGSDSNYIVELKAVVWDPTLDSYVIKTFTRNNPDISAFLVHIGRAIITEVTLMVGKNYNMRCISRLDVPASELFAHPRNSSRARTMEKYMDEYGRVDAIWFPFVESPWLKLWEVAEKRPPTSREVMQPYNYQIQDRLEDPDIVGPDFGRRGMERLARGLTENRVWDIWGPSKDTIFYYNTTSTPLVYSGLVVLTNRANMQLVLHELCSFYTALLNEYRARDIYPIDQYIKLRVSGVDNPSDTLIPGAIAADISPTGPARSSPNFNVGVWMNTLTTTRRPFSDEFMRKFEAFVYTRFNGRDGQARPEWSKNWGHSNTAPFDNPTFLKETIPEVFGVENWNHAVETLDKYDPHHVITNSFLRELMVPYNEATSLQGGSIANGFGWSNNFDVSLHT